MNTIEKKFHLLTKTNYTEIVELLRKLCRGRRFVLLKRALHSLHPTSLALLWDSFDEAEREMILGQLTSEYAAEFLTELSVADAAILSEFGDEPAVEIRKLNLVHAHCSITHNFRNRSLPRSFSEQRSRIT